MINTNIIKEPAKKTYSAQERKELSATDREKLANAVIGWGNLKKAAMATGLSWLTIKNAVEGRRVTPPTMSRIQG